MVLKTHQQMIGRTIIRSQNFDILVYCWLEQHLFKLVQVTRVVGTMPFLRVMSHLIDFIKNTSFKY